MQSIATSYFLAMTIFEAVLVTFVTIAFVFFVAIVFVFFADTISITIYM